MEVDKIEVYDNFFTNEEFDRFLNEIRSTKFPCPYPPNPGDNITFKHNEYQTGFSVWIPRPRISNEFSKIISTNPKQFSGVEWWVHDMTNNSSNPTPSAVKRHSDYDEILYSATKKKRTALKTFVYYPILSEDFSGGQLTIYYKNTNNQLGKVTPKINRLVCFDSENEHEISNYCGHRVSVILNIWKQRPIVEFS